MEIIVTSADANTFNITVADKITTTHRVTLTDDYHQKLCKKNIPKEKLIEKSFEFLLERESNSMIFSEFNLSVISTYFSNFEKDIAKRLKSG